MSVEDYIIGSSTQALLYCLFTEATLIINSDRRPPVYSQVSGVPESLIWEEVYWLLFLQNRVVTNQINTINLYSEKIELIHGNNTRSTILFKTLRIINHENIDSFDFDICVLPSPLEVRDYFAVKKGMSHTADRITTGDEFVHEVRFYPSSRIDGNKTMKDVATISYLDHDSLLDFDYSETMARFKLEKLMNANLGLSRKVQTRHLKREIIGPEHFILEGQRDTIARVEPATTEEMYGRYKSEYTG